MKPKFIFCLALILSAGLFGCSTTPNYPSGLPLRYYNAQYDFTFFLPTSWKGYSVLLQQWESEVSSADYQKMIGTERGPVIVLRNAQWKATEPYQDFPIHVFTRRQWELEIKEHIFVDAGGLEDEIAHNDKYVFSISSRFDWGEVKGFEEARRIVSQNQNANKPFLPHK